MAEAKVSLLVLTQEQMEAYGMVVSEGRVHLWGPLKESCVINYYKHVVTVRSNLIVYNSENHVVAHETDSYEEAVRVSKRLLEIFPHFEATGLWITAENLRKIADVACRYETYNHAHVAAAANLPYHLEERNFKQAYSRVESRLAQSLLHVSVLHAKLPSFYTLTTNDLFGQVVDDVDNDGNNILHIAAACTDFAVLESVFMLLDLTMRTQYDRNKLREMLIQWNHEGLAPIHIGTMNRNRKGVLAMMKSDFRDYIKDIPTRQTRETPVHLAIIDHKLLYQLLKLGSSQKLMDHEGLVPLEKSVNQNYDDSVKALLMFDDRKNCRKTSAEVRDMRKTVLLHTAAQNCNVNILVSLIIFGEHLEVKNEKNQTPRHIVASLVTNHKCKGIALFYLVALGARRCKSDVEGCQDGCKHNGINIGEQPPNWPISVFDTDSDGKKILRHEIKDDEDVWISDFLKASNNKTAPKNILNGRLLCLDGGGLRGIILTQMLDFIEQMFCDGGSILKYVDWLAGTSTGGILALALARGFNAIEAQSLYLSLKERAFSGTRTYDGKILESLLKETFTETAKMSEIENLRVMIMATKVVKRPVDLEIFRNYEKPFAPKGSYPNPKMMPIWLAAFLTGAAPSYYTLSCDTHCDGGLVSNNPTLDALTEIDHFKTANGEEYTCPSTVLSFGTGVPPAEPCKATDLDCRYPGSLRGGLEAVCYVGNAVTLAKVAVQQMTMAYGVVVERARSYCHTNKIPFSRFSPKLGVGVKLDEKDNEVLLNSMFQARVSFASKYEEFRYQFENHMGGPAGSDET